MSYWVENKSLNSWEQCVRRAKSQGMRQVSRGVLLTANFLISKKWGEKLTGILLKTGGACEVLGGGRQSCCKHRGLAVRLTQIVACLRGRLDDLAPLSGRASAGVIF